MFKQVNFNPDLQSIRIHGTNRQIDVLMEFIEEVNRQDFFEAWEELDFCPICTARFDLDSRGESILFVDLYLVDVIQINKDNEAKIDLETQSLLDAIMLGWDLVGEEEK